MRRTFARLAARTPVRRHVLLLPVLALALVGAACGVDSRATTSAAQAVQTQESDVPMSIPTIVDDVAPSVVTVKTETGEGSGVVWSADGLIVTNEHVIDEARDIRVIFADGQETRATTRAADSENDLAVLHVDRDGLPTVTFAPELPEVGEWVIAIGDPLGLENSVTAGIVSAVQRSLAGATDAPLVDLIQTDAAISPGNSGGALVDTRGLVVGINVAYIPPSARAVSIGFAIPSATVRDVVSQLLADGNVTHPVLGVRATTVTPQLGGAFDLRVDHGAVVLSVVPGSPAADAGVRRGDVITKFGDTDVRAIGDLTGALAMHEPGDTVQMIVMRGGGEQHLTVVVGGR